MVMVIEEHNREKDIGGDNQLGGRGEGQSFPIPPPPNFTPQEKSTQAPELNRRQTTPTASRPIYFIQYNTVKN